jgi:pyruvate dehydrogenase E1 component alpha subunit
MLNKQNTPIFKMESELFFLYKELIRIRKIEETIAEKYLEWKMRCPIHLSIGQEAIPVGVSMHLTKKDHVYSNHRSHGHYFAKGGSLKKMIAELYGKDTGCCGGRGGSMHLIDLEVGFMGSTPIVGGTVPLAVGDAWSAKIKGEDRVTVIYFGDGCFEEGVLHECMNFASLHKLSIIFICENNNYSVYTELKDRQPDRKIINIADSHGLKTYTTDGNDVLKVSRLMHEALSQIKLGDGPLFFELDTYRWLEHCGPSDDDHLKYRPKGELEAWKKKCPIKKLKKYIESNCKSYKDKFESIDKEISEEILNAFDFAKNSPKPQIKHLDRYVYAD